MIHDQDVGDERGADELAAPQDRKTDPDLNAPVTVGQTIEIVERLLKPIRLQVKDIHEMVMGIDLGGGRVAGGLGKGFHDVHSNLSVVKGQTEMLASEILGDEELGKKPLAERIAEAIANKFMKLFQEKVMVMQQRMDIQQHRIDQLEAHVRESQVPPPSSEGEES